MKQYLENYTLEWGYCQRKFSSTWSDTKRSLQYLIRNSDKTPMYMVVYDPVHVYVHSPLIEPINNLKTLIIRRVWHNT
jgi:hypothetical protein